MATTVAELRREVEIAREGLKCVDENIRKLTGRDPSDLRFPGRRVTLKRDFCKRSGLQGPVSKRQDTIGAGGRLWSRVVVTRTDGEHSFHQLDSDGDDDEDSKKPAIQSSVIATPSPLRLKRESVVNVDVKTKSRNRRMFGMLLGTLQKFKQDNACRSEKEKRREEINKKLEEKEEKEKEEVAIQKRELFMARRTKQADLKRLEWKVELTAMQEEWDHNSLMLCRSIKTKATPPIFYIPANPTDKTIQLLEESSRAIKRAMTKRRAEIEEELEKQAEREMHVGEGGTSENESGEKRKHTISEGGGGIQIDVLEGKGNDHTNQLEEADTREVIIGQVQDESMTDMDMN